MNLYLCRDLSNLVREYVSNPKEDYNDVMRQLYENTQKLDLEFEGETTYFNIPVVKICTKSGIFYNNFCTKLNVLFIYMNIDDGLYNKNTLESCSWVIRKYLDDLDDFCSRPLVGIGSQNSESMQELHPVQIKNSETYTRVHIRDINPPF